MLSQYVREKIRTPDTLVRSQVLYPAELRAHNIWFCRVILNSEYYYITKISACQYCLANIFLRRLHLFPHIFILVIGAEIRACILPPGQETDHLVLVQILVADIVFVIFVVDIVAAVLTAGRLYLFKHRVPSVRSA